MQYRSIRDADTLVPDDQLDVGGLRYLQAVRSAQPTYPPKWRVGAWVYDDRARENRRVVDVRWSPSGAWYYETPGRFGRESQFRAPRLGVPYVDHQHFGCAVYIRTQNVCALEHYRREFRAAADRLGLTPGQLAASIQRRYLGFSKHSASPRDWARYARREALGT